MREVVPGTGCFEIAVSVHAATTEMSGEEGREEAGAFEEHHDLDGRRLALLCLGLLIRVCLGLRDDCLFD